MRVGVWTAHSRSREGEREAGVLDRDLECDEWLREREPLRSRLPPLRSAAESDPRFSPLASALGEAALGARVTGERLRLRPAGDLLRDPRSSALIRMYEVSPFGNRANKSYFHSSDSLNL